MRTIVLSLVAAAAFVLPASAVTIMTASSASAVDCAPGVVCTPPPCTTKSCPNYALPVAAPDPVEADPVAAAPSPTAAVRPHHKRLPHPFKHQH